MMLFFYTLNPPKMIGLYWKLEVTWKGKNGTFGGLRTLLKTLQPSSGVGYRGFDKVSSYIIYIKDYLLVY